MFNIRIKLLINFDRIQISPAGIPYKDGPPSPPNLVTPHAHQKNRKKKNGISDCMHCVHWLELVWPGKKSGKKEENQALSVIVTISLTEGRWMKPPTEEEFWGKVTWSSLVGVYMCETNWKCVFVALIPNQIKSCCEGLECVHKWTHCFGCSLKPFLCRSLMKFYFIRK